MGTLAKQLRTRTICCWHLAKQKIKSYCTQCGRSFLALHIDLHRLFSAPAPLLFHGDRQPRRRAPLRHVADDVDNVDERPAFQVAFDETRIVVAAADRAQDGFVFSRRLLLFVEALAFELAQSRRPLVVFLLPRR